MIDICGSIVGFMYNGKPRYKSSIGGLLSLFLIGGILAIIIVYLYDFFARDKAKMTFENVKYWNPPNLQISENFDFIVMTQFEGNNEVRDDIFQIEGFYIQKNSTSWIRKKIPSIPCSPQESSLEHLFIQLELTKGKCFNMSGISIGGSRVNDEFKYFQIKVTFCKGASCYPKDQIEKLINSKKPLALIYYLDTAFQINNATNRLKKFYNNVDINITYQDTKETTVYFSNNELHVDTNYFFPSPPIKFREFMIDSTRDLVSVRNEDSLDSLLVNFMSSKKTEMTYISYTQISELLTNVCALTNVIIILISSIGNYFNHYLFQADLMNALYDIHSRGEYTSGKANNTINSIDPDKGLIDNAIKFQKISRKKTVDVKVLNYVNTAANINNLSATKVNRSNNFPIAPTDQSAFGINIINNANTTQEKIKKTRFSRCDVIKLSLIPYKCIICKRIKEKKKMFEIITKSLMLYQDLRNVYRKIQEVDVMKYLFLTEDQLALYQIITKPDFKKVNESLNSKEFASLVNQPKYHFMKSKGEVERALLNPELKALLLSKTTGKGNDIDEKLIKLINKE